MNPISMTKSLAKCSGALAGIILSLSLVVGAQAQEIPKAQMDTARAVVKETGASARFDNILPVLAERIKGRLIANQPDQGEKITEVVNQVALELAPRRGDLETEIATVYAKSFSEEELVQIKDFFASEAGAKFLKLSPILLRETDKASKIWAAGINRDMTLKVGEMLRASGVPDKGASAEGAAVEGEAVEGAAAEEQPTEGASQ